jgi:uncharacterized membrane protein
MKLSYLIKGPPGHPLHPPLTHAAIGSYTAATGMAIAAVTGVSKQAAAHGWWLALLLGLIFSAGAVLTGLVEWLGLQARSPRWWTATYHMVVMAAASVCFVIAVINGHSGYKVGHVDTFPAILTFVGFGFLALGGWLGGSLVFTQGMRVLGVAEPQLGAARTAKNESFPPAG